MTSLSRPELTKRFSSRGSQPADGLVRVFGGATTYSLRVGRGDFKATGFSDFLVGRRARSSLPGNVSVISGATCTEIDLRRLGGNG